MSNADDKKQMGKLLAKVWADDAFKQRLLADPAAVMRENGVAVPQGITIRIHEDTETVRNVTLPRCPSTLSDEQLDLVAGGAGVAPLTVTAVVPY